MTSSSSIHRLRRLGGVAALAATAAVLAAPAGASAADWRATVVDVDRSRGTVATAMGSGDVRTVRLPSQTVRRAKVGRRISVSGARKLADGTYRAQRTRSGRRSPSTRLRGTVVGQDRRTRRIFVSSGGSVLSLRSGLPGRARAAAAGVEAGDMVVARVRFGSRSRVLDLAKVRDVGDASALELEGIVLGLEGGVLRVAVARRGEVAITVPEGLLTQAPAAGDQVEAVVSVAPDGSFTLVALDTEGEDGSDDDEHGLEVDEEDGEVKAEGILQSLSTESITVAVGSQALTCLVPAGADLSGFAVGDEVEAKCVLGEGLPVLRKLESEHIEFKVDDDGTFVVEDERTEDAEDQGEDDAPDEED